jgi:hypothetical protein
MIALLLALLAIVPRVREGDVQSFTSLTDAQGKALAQGKYLQRVEGDVLHVEARYDFPDAARSSSVRPCACTRTSSS